MKTFTILHKKHKQTKHFKGMKSLEFECGWHKHMQLHIT